MTAVVEHLDSSFGLTQQMLDKIEQLQSDPTTSSFDELGALTTVAFDEFSEARAEAMGIGLSCPEWPPSGGGG